MYVAVGYSPFLRRCGYINIRLCCVIPSVRADECSGCCVLLCELVSCGAGMVPGAVCLCVCVDVFLNISFFFQLYILIFQT